MIKARKGLLPLPDPVSWWSRAVDLFHGKVLPICTSHISALAALPEVHRDPFDRILIAQAVAEGWAIASGDRQFADYPVQLIW